MESELAGRARSVVIGFAYERAIVSAELAKARRFRSRQGGREATGGERSDHSRSDQIRPDQIGALPQVRRGKFYASRKLHGAIDVSEDFTFLCVQPRVQTLFLSVEEITTLESDFSSH